MQTVGGLLTARHNATQQVVSAMLNAIGVSSTVKEVRLNDVPAAKGDAFATSWALRFEWQTNGLRPIVEDTTIWSSYDLARLHKSARQQDYTLKLAIKAKRKQKLAYCEAKGWDLWVHAFNTQGGIDPQSVAQVDHRRFPHWVFWIKLGFRKF